MEKEKLYTKEDMAKAIMGTVYTTCNPSTPSEEDFMQFMKEDLELPEEIVSMILQFSISGMMAAMETKAAIKHMPHNTKEVGSVEELVSKIKEEMAKEEAKESKKSKETEEEMDEKTFHELLHKILG